MLINSDCLFIKLKAFSIGDVWFHLNQQLFARADCQIVGIVLEYLLDFGQLTLPVETPLVQHFIDQSKFRNGERIQRVSSFKLHMFDPHLFANLLFLTSLSENGFLELLNLFFAELSISLDVRHDISELESIIFVFVENLEKFSWIHSMLFQPAEYFELAEINPQFSCIWSFISFLNNSIFHC